MSVKETTEVSEKLLSGNNDFKELYVSSGDYTAGMWIEGSFGVPVATAGAKKREAIVYEKKKLDAAGKILCIVSGNVNKKNVTDNVNDTKINSLSEFGIFVE